MQDHTRAIMGLRIGLRLADLAQAIEQLIPEEEREDFVIQHVNRLYTEKIINRFIKP